MYGDTINNLYKDIYKLLRVGLQVTTDNMVQEIKVCPVSTIIHILIEPLLVWDRWINWIVIPESNQINKINQFKDRLANCHSIRVRLKQLTHPKSSFRVRKSGNIAQSSTSFISLSLNKKHQKCPILQTKTHSIASFIWLLRLLVGLFQELFYRSVRHCTRLL